jgi:hypothetical protein
MRMNLRNVMPKKCMDRLLFTLLLAGLPLTVGDGAVAGRRRSGREKPTVTDFHGAVMIALDSTGFSARRLCIPLGVVLESRDFFDGLQRVRSPLEMEFHYRKGSKPVEEFPESLLVQIRVVPAVCGLGEIGVGPHQPLVWDEQFMRSWRFQLNWVVGARVNPVDIISTEGWIPAQNTAGDDQWRYNFQIDSRKIPIASNLKLEVLSPDGQLLARLIGGMDRAIPCSESQDSLVGHRIHLF